MKGGAGAADSVFVSAQLDEMRCKCSVSSVGECSVDEMHSRVLGLSECSVA